LYLIACNVFVHLLSVQIQDLNPVKLSSTI
jgi:hypothetical protein